MNQIIFNSLSEYITVNILRQPQRKISPSEALISSGLIDSFSLVDLALFIEENHGVRIDDTELNASTLDSLEQLVAIIEERS